MLNLDYQPPTQKGMNAIPTLPEMPMPQVDPVQGLAQGVADEFHRAMSDIDMADYSAGLSPHHESLFEQMATAVKPRADIDAVAQAANQGVPPSQFSAMKRYQAFEAEAPVRLQGILGKYQSQIESLSDKEYKAMQAELAKLTTPQAPQMEQFQPGWEQALGALLATAFGGTQAGNTAAGAIMQRGNEGAQMDFQNRMQEYKVAIQDRAERIDQLRERYTLAERRGQTALQNQYQMEAAAIEKERQGLLRLAEEEMQQAGQTQRTILNNEGRLTLADVQGAIKQGLQDDKQAFEAPKQAAQVADLKSKTKERETLLPTKLAKAIAENRWKDAQTEYVKANTALAEAKTGTELGKIAMEGAKLEVRRGELNRRIALDLAKVKGGKPVNPKTGADAIDMAIKLGSQIARLTESMTKEDVPPAMRLDIQSQIEFLKGKMQSYYQAADALNAGMGGSAPMTGAITPRGFVPDGMGGSRPLGSAK